VRLVISESAAALISERGGRLFVWTKSGRCCGAAPTRQHTRKQAPSGRAVRRVAGGEPFGFDLYLPAALERLPDELHFESRRFPRRVEAYWTGCAWVG
jgi:hypothetical protein